MTARVPRTWVWNAVKLQGQNRQAKGQGEQIDENRPKPSELWPGLVRARTRQYTPGVQDKHGDGVARSCFLVRYPSFSFLLIETTAPRMFRSGLWTGGSLGRVETVRIPSKSDHLPEKPRSVRGAVRGTDARDFVNQQQLNKSREFLAP